MCYARSQHIFVSERGADGLGNTYDSRHYMENGGSSKAPDFQQLIIREALRYRACATRPLHDRALLRVSQRCIAGCRYRYNCVATPENQLTFNDGYHVLCDAITMLCYAMPCYDMLC